MYTEQDLNVEIDGCFHFNRVEYDDRRDRFLKRCDFGVLRIPNDQVATFDLQKIFRKKDKPLARYRSALARANAKGGMAISRGQYVEPI